MGFNPASDFTADNEHPIVGYPNSVNVTQDVYEANLRSRSGLYLQLENANAYRIENLYADFGTDFTGEEFVLCDVYSNV